MLYAKTRLMLFTTNLTNRILKKMENFLRLPRQSCQMKVLCNLPLTISERGNMAEWLGCQKYIQRSCVEVVR